MRRIHRASLPLLTAALLIFSAEPSDAQFGVGAGLAALGDNIADAGANVKSAIDEQNLEYGDVGGVLGFFGMLQFRGGAELFRFVGDVSYVYFPDQTIRLLSGNAEDTSATFDVGSTLIPLAFGGDVVIPVPVVKPYVGAELTYTIFTRTITLIQGDPRVNTPELRNQWEGEDQFGFSVRGGVTFQLGPVGLDAGLRYNFADFFTRDEGAEPRNYLQAGVSVLFGSTGGEDREEEKE